MYTEVSSQQPITIEASRMAAKAIDTLPMIEEQRQNWVIASLDDQIMVHMLLGQPSSKWLHSAGATLTYAMLVGQHWNLTDSSPDMRTMSRALNAIRDAVVLRGSLIDAEVLVKSSRGLDVAREKIIRKCPPAALVNGMRAMKKALNAM